MHRFLSMELSQEENYLNNILYVSTLKFASEMYENVHIWRVKNTLLLKFKLLIL